MTPITIDVTEQFPLLPKAPIAEAVIGIRAQANVEWNEEAVRSALSAKLPDYPDIESLKQVQIAAMFEPGVLPSQRQEESWYGLKATSADKRQIVQFKRDGFLFSRLAPYQDWNRFCDEAVRLWLVHAEVTRPAEIQRIGVRFINRMALGNDSSRIREVLRTPPAPPEQVNVPIRSYFHQDDFDVVGHPYLLRRVQTIQEAKPTEPAGLFLILDIDVSVTGGFEPNIETVKKYLTEMRAG